MSHISELHEDLLIKIAKKLLTLQDFVRFGAVCRPLRFATLQKDQFPLLSKPSFPWLMVTQNDDNTRRAFFSPLENKTRTIELPEARGCQCWGSPFGWLVTHRVVRGTIEIHLLNPLSRVRIPLPLKVDFFGMHGRAMSPLQGMDKAKIISIAESNNKGNMKYLVLAWIRDIDRLVFARDGADTWITIEDVSYKNYFKGVCNTEEYQGCLKIVDIISTVPVVKSKGNLLEMSEEKRLSYSFVLNSELHMVVRSWKPWSELGFNLYKFDENTREWTKVQTMGDNVVFVGANSSFALKASEYPGCKPDCIYFTDKISSNNVRDNETGIFNMKTQKFDNGGRDFVSSHAVWIAPRIK